MKIFVTFGLEWFPFNRLIKYMDNFEKECNDRFEIFIQKGRTELNPENCNFVDLLSPTEFIKKIKESDIIICHGGVGTVLSCLYNKKNPIVIPRLRKFKEHIDNHQMEFCNLLEKNKKAIVAMNQAQLFDCIYNFTKIKKSMLNSKDYSSCNSLILNLKEKINNIKMEIK